MSGQAKAGAEEKREFHTLNALRGLAALAVVALHYPEMFASLKPTEAYLAVDLFFLMSGVVVAHAYDARLDSGLGAGTFLIKRICRLYPLFAIGTLVSICGVTAGLATGQPVTWTWSSLSIATATSALFLPSPILPGKDEYLYPLNYPAWSLAYELIINFVYALSWRWLRGHWLTLVVVLAAIVLVAVSLSVGNLDQGARYSSMPAGAVRVTFSFFLGVAMSRACKRWHAPAVPTLLVVAAATALLLFPVAEAWRSWYDAACVVIGFPALVWLAIGIQPRRGVWLCTALGAISYPIYILQVPSLLIVHNVFNRILASSIAPYVTVFGLVAIAGLIFLSWVLAVYIDPPLRRAAEAVAFGRRGAVSFRQHLNKRPASPLGNLHERS